MEIRLEGPSGPHRLQMPSDTGNMVEEPPTNELPNQDDSGDEAVEEVAKPAYVN